MEGFKILNIEDELEFTLRYSDSKKAPEALNVKILAKDRRSQNNEDNSFDCIFIIFIIKLKKKNWFVKINFFSPIQNPI
jgi:hypothetical protein